MCRSGGTCQRLMLMDFHDPHRHVHTYTLLYVQACTTELRRSQGWTSSGMTLRVLNRKPWGPC